MKKADADLSAGLFVLARTELPVAQLYAFFDLALDHLALERAQVLNEQIAVKVLRLVRHAARFEVHNVEREGFAVYVLRAHDDPLGPRHLKVYSRKTQTALIAYLLALFGFDNRVYERDLARLLAAGAAIHHEQPFEYSYLRGGKPYAVCAVHGLEHIVYHLAQTGVELGNLFGAFGKRRIAIFDYL
jgi:hypothetical protein